MQRVQPLVFDPGDPDFRADPYPAYERLRAEDPIHETPIAFVVSRYDDCVAVLRDRVSGKRYSMKPGDRAGRLSVVSVRERDVLFSIEDFGYERQETLSLPKREVELQ